MNTIRKIAFSFVFFFFLFSPIVKAQSKFSLMPGLFYNGTGFEDDVNGFGVVLGLEYMQRPDHFFSIEVRTKYAYYSFDDGTKWKENSEGVLEPPKNRGEARLEYSLFSPQVGVVPKFHLHLDETLSLFVENELAIGFMAGGFRYRGAERKKHFTEPLLIYNIGVGVEYKVKKCSLIASVSYSTLNFREKIRKHQPAGYQEGIPNQDAVMLINVVCKVPL